MAIVDNDDFKSDTHTGADQPHRTNVMFVQPESFDFEPLESHETRPVPSAKLASSLSASVKALGSEMQKIVPYKTIKRGEPPIRTKTEKNSILLGTSTQRTRGVIHALARAQDDLSRPKPEEQQVPGYKGFHAAMSQAQEKSRAIYHMTRIMHMMPYLPFHPVYCARNISKFVQSFPFYGLFFHGIPFSGSHIVNIVTFRTGILTEYTEE